jgi:septum formation protein
MDKGGAYAIQGIGGKLINNYHGNMDSIVGLPLNTLKNLIKKVTS